MRSIVLFAAGEIKVAGIIPGSLMLPVSKNTVATSCSISPIYMKKGKPNQLDGSAIPKLKSDIGILIIMNVIRTAMGFYPKMILSLQKR